MGWLTDWVEHPSQEHPGESGSEGGIGEEAETEGGSEEATGEIG